MSSSDFLRKNKNQHSVKNFDSKSMDKAIDVAVVHVLKTLQKEYPSIKFMHDKSMHLTEIINELKKTYKKYDFSSVLDSSFIKPDGGFIYFYDNEGKRQFVLISEVKRQGTNDKRKKEGLPKQAQGNAIERLGKNLTGIRALLNQEGIIPFVTFGHGHDFVEGSSILDRVVTMNQFFPLNTIFVEKSFLPFEPVTMMFREKEWGAKEMQNVLLEVSRRAMKFYGF
ncbi:MAG: EcoRI family type II restriction endonuclease [Candidatus Paceibacterota bacterium]